MYCGAKSEYSALLVCVPGSWSCHEPLLLPVFSFAHLNLLKTLSAAATLITSSAPTHTNSRVSSVQKQFADFALVLANQVFKESLLWKYLYYMTKLYLQLFGKVFISWSHYAAYPISHDF